MMIVCFCQFEVSVWIVVTAIVTLVTVRQYHLSNNRRGKKTPTETQHKQNEQHKGTLDYLFKLWFYSYCFSFYPTTYVVFTDLRAKGRHLKKS